MWVDWKISAFHPGDLFYLPCIQGSAGRREQAFSAEACPYGAGMFYRASGPTDTRAELTFKSK